MTEGITELGHVGLFVHDLDVMRVFYEETMGLSVSDINADTGAVFMSARPEYEHHEVLLVPGREVPEGTRWLQQLSWRVDSIESLQKIYNSLLSGGTEIVGVVTHGNTISVYFLDPEGNTTEIYVPTGLAVPQPFREPISLEGTAEEILRQSAHLVGTRQSVSQ